MKRNWRAGGKRGNAVKDDSRRRPLDFSNRDLSSKMMRQDENAGIARVSRQGPDTSIGYGQSIPIHISTPDWADNADQLPGRVSASGKRGVNALGECGGIGVVAGADDDSGMSPLGFAM